MLSVLDRIIYRAKQFFFAIAAQMTEEDKSFARHHLDIKESALFFSLPSFEQKHAVVVAQKMKSAAAGNKSIDQRRLVRLGLLHDIGKSAVKLSIFDKSMLVVLHRAIPPLYNLLAKLGEPENSNPILRKFYVHKHHGVIGSKLLSRIGESQDIINEVAEHDAAKDYSDPYMKILIEADSTY